MTQDTIKTGENISRTLIKYADPKDEAEYLTSIISELYHLNTDPSLVDEIIETIYNNLVTNTQYQNQLNEWNWEDYDDYIQKIYFEDSSHVNGGLEALSILLRTRFEDKTAKEIIDQFRNELEPYDEQRTYRYEMATNTYVLLDEKKQKIIKQHIRIVNNKDASTEETVINAYPKELIIHDTPLDDIGRTFSVKWISHGSSRIFQTKKQTIKEIETYLDDAGWVMSPRSLRGILAVVVQICIENKLAVIKSEIDNPGFYYDTQKRVIKNINYKVEPVTEKQLREVVQVVDELHEYFKGGGETKLATGLKWGLMAPFDYCIKQIGGDYLPWLYLYGKAGSGKTTLGKILLFLWSTPNEDNDIGGSGFDTVARVGEKISQSTFPILVNEPEGALNKPSIKAILKSSIESTTARGKFHGGTYKTIPSFSPVIMTANQGLPEGDALFRRFLLMLFTHNEKKGAEVKKDFNEHFRVNSPRISPLHKLKYISQWFALEIQAKPDLLLMNWKELANQLIMTLYMDLGLEVPGWLLTYYNNATLEDLDDEEIEEIRMFLLEEINKKTNKIQVWDEETGRPKNDTLDTNGLKSSKEFDDRVWTVLNERQIPWIILKKKGRKGNEYEVCFTSGIKDRLKEITSQAYNLKALSELLGWEYKTVKLQPKSLKLMVVDYDEFMSFLYPDLVEAIDNFEDSGGEWIDVD